MSGHPQAPPVQAGFPCPLGDFVLTGMLGEGGTGVVYAARWGHREVALKVLHPSLIATPSERERFFAEAKLLSEITHPGVVKVLNFGALPDGRPYLAMEKLDGESLAARLARGRLAVPETLALAHQMIGAIEALHGRGLIHRDIKPENVFLVSGRYAVLLDFGIAKELDAPASTVTQDGGVRGTPAYMAPERFFGQPATPRTDIYELAVVMYAMLVGRLPWDNVADPESRLNPRKPSELGAPLPGQLETALFRALSTRPESRPQSARAFLDEINRAMGSSEPVRRTADVDSGPAPRRTEDLASPPAPMPTPAHGGLPYQPTTPASPAAMAAFSPPQPQMTPPHPQQAYTTTAQTQAKGRAIWPWLVAGIAVATVAAVIAVLVTRGGDEKLTGEAAAAAAAEDETTEAAERDLAPVPIWKDDDDDDGAGAPPAEASSLTGTPLPPAPGLERIARHHPADTTLLIGLRVRQLLADQTFGQVLRGLEKNPEVAPLLLMGEMCKVDPFADVDWISIGMAPGDNDDVDVAVSGQMDRARVDACAGDLADGPAHVWLDDQTVLFTTRPDADDAWLAARKAGKDSLAAKAAADLGAVDKSSTLWFAGRPGDAFGDVTEGDFPDSEGAYGSIALGDEIGIDLWVRYTSEADAERAQAEADEQIADFPQGLIGEMRVARQGKRLHLTTRINSMVVSMLGSMLNEELAAP